MTRPMQPNECVEDAYPCPYFYKPDLATTQEAKPDLFLISIGVRLTGIIGFIFCIALLVT